MVVHHLRRIVCLYLVRPSVESAFLVGSRRTASLYRRNQPEYMTTEQESMNEDNSSWAAAGNVGQLNIGSQNTTEQPSNICEDDVSSFADQNTSGETIIDKSWRQFLEISSARSRKIRGSNYVQIATVDSTTNEPRCRTVVFRGFLNTAATKAVSNYRFDPSTSHIIDPKTNKPLSCIMKMCTDLRSEKVHQTGPTEIVWWFAKTSEQYRIRGTMILIGNDCLEQHDRDLMIARKEMWGSLTDSSRESFLTIPRPGDIYTKEETKDQNRLYGGRDVDGNIMQPPPNNFLLMLVIPNRCDYLNLGEMFRQVDTIVDGKWQSQRVNA